MVFLSITNRKMTIIQTTIIFFFLLGKGVIVCESSREMFDLLDGS